METATRSRDSDSLFASRVFEVDADKRWEVNLIETGRGSRNTATKREAHKPSASVQGLFMVLCISFFFLMTERNRGPLLAVSKTEKIGQIVL
jgi:hypothetical protein